MMKTVLLIAVVVFGAAAYEYDIVEGDIQVPKGHQFKSMGAYQGTTLWPVATTPIPWMIDTASGISASDPRISAALAQWEAKTCIRFRPKVASDVNYLKFVYAQGVCNSPVGMLPGTFNQINMGSDCGTGAIVHEIGHSLGLNHEQTRQDRDQFVYVDLSAVKSGMGHNFEKGAGRDLLPYNYGSIMHYGTDYFASGTKPTIVSPLPIGQRAELNPGDVASIQFMYQNCQAAPALTCEASRSRTTTHLISTGKLFTVQFTALAGKATYRDITVEVLNAPASATKTVTNGFSIGTDTMISWTPSTSELGDRTISAKFTTGGQSVTCSVSVTVVGVPVCFGIAGNDPKVCSGRGTCTNDVLAPCQCKSGYGGLECDGFATCPASYVWHFDDSKEPITFVSPDSGSPITSTQGDVVAVGSGALRVYNQAYMQLQAPVAPRRISFYLRGPLTGNSPTIVFKNPSDVECMTIVPISGNWYANGQSAQLNVESRPDTWVFFDLRPNFVSQKFDVYANGKLAASQVAFQNSCSNLGTVLFFANNGQLTQTPSYIDELNLYCTRYSMASGTLLNANVASIRAGGLTLTLQLVGDFDSWVQSGLSSLIAGMTSDQAASSTNWNALRSQILANSVINGQSIVFTSVAAPSYSSDADEAITITVPKTAVASQNPGDSNMFFRIGGTCPASRVWNMDTDANALKISAGYFERASSPSVSGSSQWLKNPGYSINTVISASRASAFKYALYMGDASSQVQLSLKSGSTEVLKFTIGGNFGISVSNTQATTSISSATWYKIEVRFNWASSTYDVYVNGVISKATAKTMPTTVSSFDSFSVVGFAGKEYLDDVSVECPQRPPSATLSPAIAIVGTGATFSFIGGSSALTAADSVKLVSADCNEAGVISGSLMASTVVGTYMWTNNFNIAAGTYKVCYKGATSAAFTLLSGSFQFQAAAAPVPTASPAPTAPVTAGPTSPPPVMCDQSDCNNRAASVSGYRPNCQCQCLNSYTGLKCETCGAAFGGTACNQCASTRIQNYPTCTLCTVADYCTNRATAATVSGTTCTCTCKNYYTGAQCTNCPSSATGDQCDTCAAGYVRALIGTVASCRQCDAVADCSGHAASVSSSNGQCSCTCRNKWNGTKCQTCPAPFGGADCNQCADATKSYPGCTTATPTPSSCDASCKAKSSLCTGTVTRYSTYTSCTCKCPTTIRYCGTEKTTTTTTTSTGTRTSTITSTYSCSTNYCVMDANNLPKCKKSSTSITWGDCKPCP